MELSRVNKHEPRPEHVLPDPPAHLQESLVHVALLMARYWAYWNSGLAFKASFVAPGRINFLSINLN